jgi:putative ATPase
MKGLDYGKGYKYAHDEAGGVAADMECLPPAQAGRQFYAPTNRGHEVEIRRRLEEIRKGRKTDGD